MDESLENAGNPSVWDRGRMVAQYLLGWPFMCHAGSVLLVAWIASYLHLSVGLVCILGFLYLFQIESRQRAKLLWKVHHEEENKARKMRISEGETVRWMNKALETIWPMFLGEFSSKHLKIPLSSFLDRFKPWSMKKISVSDIFLGKSPPIVTMIRMLDDPVDGDHLAVEASIEWMAAKDMAAVVDVQFLRRISFGIRTTVHICNLCLKGKVKAGIKFKNGWPVIERLRVCFATAPHVQMTIHPLYNNGVDVSELPGIAQWMDRLMADIFARSLVEPNMIEIDVEKLMKDVMIPLDPIPVPRGAFWTMHVGAPVADVIVEVLEATDLRIGYVNGYPDPYVKVTVGHQTKTTKVQPKTLHPKWNETLKFSIATLEQLDKILINVRDKDHFYDERLGSCTVNLNSYRDGIRRDIWCELEDIKTGKIHLAITVVAKQASSLSSEDTSSYNSTTFETIDQTISREFDPSLSEGLPLSAAPSPKTHVSTRQKLKALRLREPFLSKTSPTSPVKDPNLNSGRQRSVIIDSPESRRRLESPRIASGREIFFIPGDDSSDLFTSDDVSRFASVHSTTKIEAEAINQSSDEPMAIELHVGVGESGAVKIRRFGDANPPTSPEPQVVGSTRSQSVSKSFNNIEEEGSATRKIRSAGIKLHSKYHRAKQGFKRASVPSPVRDRSQKLQNRRGFSSSNGLTVDTLGGQAANNSPTNTLLGQNDSTKTSLTPEVCGGAMDVRAIGDLEPDKEHMRNRAKGILKAAGRFGKRLNHRKTSLSSDELSSSGELTPIGGERIEVSLSGPSTDLHMQQQVASPSNRLVSSLPASISSTPPQRPPPGLPQPVTPSFDTSE